MRVSTAQLFQQGISAILDQQAQLQKTQQQLASGLRVSTPADDPVAAVQILDLTEQLSRVDRFRANADLAMGDLARQETAVQDAVDLVQRARELIVQANNASQGSESREALATEIESIRDRLLATANSRDASGDYLFAGYQATQQPFVESATGVSYAGDEGGRDLAVADGVRVQVRENGRELFMAVPLGNGSFGVSAAPGNAGTAVLGSSAAGTAFQRDEYTLVFSQTGGSGPVTYAVTDSGGATVASGTYAEGEDITFNGARLSFGGQPADGDRFVVGRAATGDIFAMLDAVAASLNSGDDSAVGRAAVNNALAGGLGNLDQALGGLLQRQAALGTQMNQVEAASAGNEAFALDLQSTLSDVRDLDYAEAISRLQLQLTTLEAAQQSYVALQRLSLFNYL